VRRVLLDGLEHPLEALGEGWSHPEADADGPFRWTSGDAELPASAAEITIEVFGKHPYWAGRPTDSLCAPRAAQPAPPSRRALRRSSGQGTGRSRVVSG
jgi:hypothetical protein